MNVAKPIKVLTIGLLALATSAAAEPVYIDVDHDFELQAIHHDNTGQFFLDYGIFLDVYRDGIESNFIGLQYDDDYSVSRSSADSQVNPSGQVHTVYTARRRDSERERTYYKLYYSICTDFETCNVRELQSYSVRDSSDRPTTYSFSDIELAPNGQVFVSLNRNRHTRVDGDWRRVTDRTYYVNGQSLGRQRALSDNRSIENEFNRLYQAAFLQDDLEATFHSSALFGNRHSGPDGNTFETGSGEYESTISPRYDRTGLQIGSRGYIISHDTNSRGLFVSFYGDGQVFDYPLDRAESGHSHYAFTVDDEIWVVHYFFRDSFNKGLLVTTANANGMVTDQFPLHLSRSDNVGLMSLLGSKSPDGSIMMAYDTGDNSAPLTVAYFPGTDAIRTAANTFAEEGHPRGSEFAEPELASNPDARNDILQAPFRSQRSIRLTGTAGLQYQFRAPHTWDTIFSEPDQPAGTDDRLLWDLDSAPSFVQIYEIEGGVGSTSFGAEFLSEQADIIAADASGAPQSGISSLKGWLGWDRLFMNYDVGISLERTSYDMVARDRRSNDIRETEVSYSRLNVYLLDLRSNRFGLELESYNTLQPANLYRSAEGSSNYSIDRQDAFEAQVYNLTAFAGYSSIDHMAKYETALNEFYLDTDGRAGLALYQFGEESGSPSENEFGLLLGFQAEAGWAAIKRFSGFGGMGGMVRAGYRVNGSVTASRDPIERDGDADSEEFAYHYSRIDLNHGPIVRLSLVY